MTRIIEWTCHICKQKRPDGRIDVLSRSVDRFKNKIEVIENIRYCNDNAKCIEKAKTYTFFKFWQGFQRQFLFSFIGTLFVIILFMGLILSVDIIYENKQLESIPKMDFLSYEGEIE